MSHQFSFLFDAYWEVISKGDDERRSWGLLVSPPSPPLRYRMDCDTDVLPVTDQVQSPCFLSPGGTGGAGL
jgi:hypothetical protein